MEHDRALDVLSTIEDAEECPAALIMSHICVRDNVVEYIDLDVTLNLGEKSTPYKIVLYNGGKWEMETNGGPE